jgi:superfamily II DNA or RNA helicase
MNDTYFTPKPHQHEMTDFMQYNKSAYVIAGLGTGKTVTSLSSRVNLQLQGIIKGTLVVAPKYCLGLAWAKEVHKWSFCYGAEVCNVRDAIVAATTPIQRDRKAKAIRQLKTGSAQFYLINYENVHRLVEFIGRERIRLPFNDVIFDEITKAKNHANKFIEPFRKHLIKYMLYRAGLTATPLGASLMDVFAQARLMDGGVALGDKITHFRNKFFERDPYCPFRYIPCSGSVEEVTKLIQHFTLVKDLDDVEEGVQPTIYETIECKMPDDAMKYYKRMRDDGVMLGLEEGEPEIMAETAGAATQKLRQIATGDVYDSDGKVFHVHDTKIIALKKLMKKHEGEPILILTSYRHEVSIICKAVEGVERFDGDKLQAWQDGKIKAWVANASSVCHGIDGLSEGGRIICWYSPTYSHDVHAQANGRINGGLRPLRIKGLKNPLIYYLVMEETIDNAIMQVVKTKATDEANFKELLSLVEFQKEYEN